MIKFETVSEKLLTNNLLGYFFCRIRTPYTSFDISRGVEFIQMKWDQISSLHWSVGLDNDAFFSFMF